MRKTCYILILLGIAILLVSCSSIIGADQGSAIAFTPTAIISAIPTPTIMPSPNAGKTPELVIAVEKYLSEQTGIPLNQITVKDIQETEWPDLCLGAPQGHEMCADVITPGYIILLSTPKGDYTIHTDKIARYIRIVQPIQQVDGLPAQNPPIIWERSGGIAGICQQFTISFDGIYLLQNCRNNTILSQGVLPEGHMSYLTGLINRYSTFQWKSTPLPDLADMFLDQYTFYGQGDEVPTADQQQSLDEYLGNLASELSITTQLSTSGGGIEGQVFIGPTCPGPVKPGATQCDDRPFQATISVFDQNHQLVTRFQTDPEGRFQIPLSPGIYILHPETEGRYPVAPDQSISVSEAQFTQVTIVYDSGIR